LFSSTIIPTIGRPTLQRAVNSVLEQDFDREDFEVIVVNDSGEPLPEEDWQSDPRIQIIHTNRHNRSVARNAGAAIARGRYLHFLDDDDWMMAGAYNSFWRLLNDRPAAWLYGGFRMVDRDNKRLVDVLPDATGNCLIQMLSFEWIPLQASLIEARAFFTAGGFAPLSSLLGGFEDIDLSRQISRFGEMAAIEDIVSVIRVGKTRSTTNYNDMDRQNRQSREKLLDSPGVFTRLNASVADNSKDSAYWSGRITYYYLGSSKRNLMDKKVIKSISRALYSLVSFVTAGRHLFSKDFWIALTRPHFNRVWFALVQAGATHVYRDQN
jgi:glycosyltransferase involved in cell wall biosynthesis